MVVMLALIMAAVQVLKVVTGSLIKVALAQ
jgi:hypothetical protein